MDLVILYQGYILVYKYNEKELDRKGSFDLRYGMITERGCMILHWEDWIGNKGMPKDIGGWQSGKKAYHIRFMNKKGHDVLHLGYSFRRCLNSL